jgi:hypothetical protein
MAEDPFLVGLGGPNALIDDRSQVSPVLRVGHHHKGTVVMRVYVWVFLSEC